MTVPRHPPAGRRARKGEDTEAGDHGQPVGGMSILEEKGPVIPIMGWDGAFHTRKSHI